MLHIHVYSFQLLVYCILTKGCAWGTQLHLCDVRQWLLKRQQKIRESPF